MQCLVFEVLLCVKLCVNVNICNRNWISRKYFQRVSILIKNIFNVKCEVTLCSLFTVHSADFGSVTLVLAHILNDKLSIETYNEHILKLKLPTISASNLKRNKIN